MTPKEIKKLLIQHFAREDATNKYDTSIKRLEGVAIKRKDQYISDKSYKLHTEYYIVRKKKV